MDNQKMRGRSEEELINGIKIVNAFSDDMNVKPGLEKCATTCLKRGVVHERAAHRKHNRTRN
jgi:hypothetical protein